jgi:hypothetical protein
MAIENASNSTDTQKRNSSPRVSLSGNDKENKAAQKEAKAERVRGYSLTKEKPDLDNILKSPDTWISPDGKYAVGPKGTLSVQLDKERIEITDQIQLYAANHLITHPLVSPALQPSLGGLPPLLIQTGGGELLRDEQIYLAHKAAHPEAYLPPPSNNQTAEEISEQASRYKPTNVQLQVWDDLCHVAPTLSFTRPAKHMYRSVAQFGAWALARAQKTSIDILDDDDISFVSTDSESAESEEKSKQSKKSKKNKKSDAPEEPRMGTDGIIDPGNHEARVGKAGDPLPSFEHHMIRQRVDRHGYIYALPSKEELVALNLPVSEVGVPKPGPVNKWMKASQQWNGKFAKQKIKIQQQRMKEMKAGFERFEGETPPPTALAGRRIKNMKKEKAAKKSWGMALWSLWGSKHDELTVSGITYGLLSQTLTTCRSTANSKRTRRPRHRQRHSLQIRPRVRALKMVQQTSQIATETLLLPQCSHHACVHGPDTRRSPTAARSTSQRMTWRNCQGSSRGWHLPHLDWRKPR